MIMLVQCSRGVMFILVHCVDESQRNLFRNAATGHMGPYVPKCETSVLFWRCRYFSVKFLKPLKAE